MNRERSLSSDKVLLMLFPPRRLGKKILRRFLKGEYKVFLFTLSEEDREYFSNFKKGGEESPSVIRVETPLQTFWGKIPPLKDTILRPRVTIHFMGKDFLEIKIGGRDEEWEINPSDTAQIKFAFIETILQNFCREDKSVWINLASGVHARSETGQIFCNTRYGLTGFTKVMELTPHLANIEVINVCLTYFGKASEGVEMVHCSHCVTEKLIEQGLSLGEKEDISELLVRRIEALLSPTTNRK
ncbi:MAG: hypothetical protein ACUVXI_01995 [bacterium]